MNSLDKKIHISVTVILFSLFLLVYLAACARRGSESEEMKENNYYQIQGMNGITRDSTIVSFKKIINEDLPGFTFYVHFAQDAVATAFEYYENIPASNRFWMENITIISENGSIVQEIRNFDRILFDQLPSRNFEDWWMPAFDFLYGIGFADYNFDGFLDLIIPRFGDEGQPLRFAFGNFHHFLWDNGIGQFVLNEQLIELERHGFFKAQEDFRTDHDIWELGNSGIRLNEGTQLLEFVSNLSGSWFYFPPLGRHMAHWIITQYYRYVDGEFVIIHIQEKMHDWEYTWRVRDLDKITDIETIIYVEGR